MSKRNKKQQHPEKDAPPQAGDRLRFARESRDLSVEDVSIRLKLDVGKINALEQGDISSFAAPVFAAGYLRTYARLLELSEAEVLADFEELASVHAQVIDPASTVSRETYSKMTHGESSQFSLRDKSSGHYWGKAGFASVLVAGLVYFLWPVSEGEQTDTAGLNTNSRLTEKTVEIAVPALKVVTEVKTNDVQLTEAQNLAAEHVVETESPELVSPEVPVEPVVVPEVETETSVEGQSSELVLIFNSDSWAEVQDARGQRLVYRLGKSGTRSAVKGAAPFNVQLGYVQGVDILYNGAEYDLSQYANRRSVQLRIGIADEHMDGE